MCMEDVRIGRKTNGRINSVAIGTAATLVVPGSETRVGLLLGGNSTDTVTYSTEPSVAIDGGLVIGVGQPPIKLYIDRDGDLVRKAWYGIMSTGAHIVGIGQTFLTEK